MPFLPRNLIYFLYVNTFKKKKKKKKRRNMEPAKFMECMRAKFMEWGSSKRINLGCKKASNVKKVKNSKSSPMEVVFLVLFSIFMLYFNFVFYCYRICGHARQYRNM
jgi:hypothetical protein